MNNIPIIISCGKHKVWEDNPNIDKKLDSELVYTSSLSNLMKEYIKIKYNPSIFYILSAKYGIISSKTKIENYNVSFYDKDKCITVEQIKKQLLEELRNTKEIIFIGGKLYTSILSQIFETIHTPIPSLSIGYMMQYLRKEIDTLKSKSKNNLFEF